MRLRVSICADERRGVVGVDEMDKYRDVVGIICFDAYTPYQIQYYFTNTASKIFL
jgi:hypothetical protein